MFDQRTVAGYVLKADIRHYFDSIDHDILLEIINRKIKDQNLLWLIKIILKNHNAETIGKGMPLGNLTSQFFANVYLNELDWFVKHKLQAKYYIRYVDDFVILHRDRMVLENWKREIDIFLKTSLKIGLHPEKSGIFPINQGITMLGYRVFYKYRLLKRSNAKRIWKRLDRFRQKCDRGEMTEEDAVRSLAGWVAYASFANTYNLRRRVVTEFNQIA